MTEREPTLDLITGSTRRTVLRGAVVAGASVPFLAACSNSDDGSGDTGGGDTGGGDTGDTGGGGGEEPTGPIASVADVPEGGGLILDDPKVVITQPAAGEFKAFSSICTHMQCPVDNVTDGTINCICHGSMYSIEDGSVVGGPAPDPLPEQTIKVQGDDISLSTAG